MRVYHDLRGRAIKVGDMIVYNDKGIDNTGTVKEHLTVNNRSLADIFENCHSVLVVSNCFPRDTIVYD